MLKPAQDYKEELERKMRETWGNEKYKYYHCNSYYSPIGIEDDTWNKMQFASVNPSGEVIGYLGYSIERECRYVRGLEICNFTDDPVFGVDVKEMIKDIFEKHRLRKIDFYVVIGNPVKYQYDRMVEIYGGRAVGFRKEHVMLMDGKLYDQKLYEILREDYMKKRYGGGAE